MRLRLNELTESDFEGRYGGKKSGFIQTDIADVATIYYNPDRHSLFIVTPDLPDGFKTCAMCAQEKPLADFANRRSSRDGKHSYCKPCDNEARKLRKAEAKKRERKNTQWSEELFLQKLAEHHPDLSLASPYVKSTESVLLECAKCGHKIKMRPRDVGTSRFAGYCKECVRLKNGRTFMAELLKAGYFPQFQVADFKSVDTPMAVTCPNGNPWKVRYSDFITAGRRPYRCPCEKCKVPVPQKRRTERQALDELAELGFIVASQYTNTDTHVLGLWVNCGHYSVVRPKCVFIGKASCMTCFIERNKKQP